MQDTYGPNPTNRQKKIEQESHPSFCPTTHPAPLSHSTAGQQECMLATEDSVLGQPSRGWGRTPAAIVACQATRGRSLPAYCIIASTCTQLTRCIAAPHAEMGHTFPSLATLACLLLLRASDTALAAGAHAALGARLQAAASDEAHSTWSLAAAGGHSTNTAKSSCATSDATTEAQSHVLSV